MQAMRQGAKWIATGCMIAVLTACTAQYRNHGYVPSPEDLAKVTVGKDTRETVLEAVGSPSSSGVLRDSAYYYVRSRVRHFGWQRPEVIERQVVAISFTKKGTVENIGRYTLQDGRVVPLTTRITKNGQDLGFIRTLLAKLGSFSAGNFLNN